jgi:hypothetical protein
VPVPAAPAVDGDDGPPGQVVRVIETGDPRREGRRDLPGNVLGDVGVRDDREVVAADVAEEQGFPGCVRHDLVEQAGRLPDDVVAPHEPVAVVVRLEIVEIGM